MRELPPLNLVTVLEDIKAKILQGWCRLDFAEDELGYEIDPTSERACRWCIMGAAKAVTHLHPHPQAFKKVRTLLHQAVLQVKTKKPTLEGWDISEYNDAPGTTREDIIHVIDLAIEKAPKQDQNQ